MYCKIMNEYLKENKVNSLNDNTFYEMDRVIAAKKLADLSDNELSAIFKNEAFVILNNSWQT